MVVSQDIMAERGLLRIVAREIREDQDVTASLTTVYDVEIDGQEVLHSFASFDEATQFLDMVAPANH